MERAQEVYENQLTEEQKGHMKSAGQAAQQLGDAVTGFVTGTEAPRAGESAVTEDDSAATKHDVQHQRVDSTLTPAEGKPDIDQSGLSSDRPADHTEADATVTSTGINEPEALPAEVHSDEGNQTASVESPDQATNQSSGEHAATEAQADEAAEAGATNESAAAHEPASEGGHDDVAHTQPGVTGDGLKDDDAAAPASSSLVTEPELSTGADQSEPTTSAHVAGDLEGGNPTQTSQEVQQDDAKDDETRAVDGDGKGLSTESAPGQGFEVVDPIDGRREAGQPTDDGAGQETGETVSDSQDLTAQSNEEHPSASTEDSGPQTSVANDNALQQSDNTDDHTSTAEGTVGGDMDRQERVDDGSEPAVGSGSIQEAGLHETQPEILEATQAEQSSTDEARSKAQDNAPSLDDNAAEDGHDRHPEGGATKGEENAAFVTDAPSTLPESSLQDAQPQQSDKPQADPVEDSARDAETLQTSIQPVDETTTDDVERGAVGEQGSTVAGREPGNEDGGVAIDNQDSQVAVDDTTAAKDTPTGECAEQEVQTRDVTEDGGKDIEKSNETENQLDVKDAGLHETEPNILETSDPSSSSQEEAGESAKANAPERLDSQTEGPVEGQQDATTHPDTRTSVTNDVQDDNAEPDPATHPAQQPDSTEERSTLAGEQAGTADQPEVDQTPDVSGANEGTTAVDDPQPAFSGGSSKADQVAPVEGHAGEEQSDPAAKDPDSAPPQDSEAGDANDGAGSGKKKLSERIMDKVRTIAH